MANWKKWLIGEWNWKRPIKSLVLIYLLLCLFALVFSNMVLFQPPKAKYTTDIDGFDLIARPNGEQVAIYYHPATAGMPTLLWSHGNAEDIGYLQERLGSFRAEGYGILAYDYPGYGRSDGKPNEQGCYEACEAAYLHLTQKINISPEHIIIYGQSVGSGPSVKLASEKPCAGLMLVSPFISAFRTVTRVPLFPGDQFKNIHRIGDVKVPLLVVHGDRDQVIPQWHGKKLYELHPGPKMWAGIDGAGHNDIYILATDEIMQSLARFREKHLPQP